MLEAYGLPMEEPLGLRIVAAGVPLLGRLAGLGRPSRPIGRRIAGREREFGAGIDQIVLVLLDAHVLSPVLRERTAS